MTKITLEPPSTRIMIETRSKEEESCESRSEKKETGSDEATNEFRLDLFHAKASEVSLVRPKASSHFEK